MGVILTNDHRFRTPPTLSAGSKWPAPVESEKSARALRISFKVKRSFNSTLRFFVRIQFINDNFRENYKKV